MNIDNDIDIDTHLQHSESKPMKLFWFGPSFQ